MSDLMDLEVMRGRLATSLADDATLIYTQAILDEAIRRALSDIAEVYGFELFLEGLDEADETNLDDADLNCLLVGASGYAVNTMLASRFNHHTPSIQADVNVMMRGASLLKDFERMLEDLRVDDLQTSDSPPYSKFEWDESYFRDEAWDE